MTKDRSGIVNYLDSQVKVGRRTRPRDAGTGLPHTTKLALLSSLLTELVCLRPKVGKYRPSYRPKRVSGSPKIGRVRLLCNAASPFYHQPNPNVSDPPAETFTRGRTSGYIDAEPGSGVMAASCKCRQHNGAGITSSTRPTT